MPEEKLVALATLPEQEWRMSVLRLISRIQEQVDQNTEITADTQEILNRDVIDKMAQIASLSAGVAELGARVASVVGQVEQMFSVFQKTLNGFRLIGAIGNGVMKTADAIYKHGRPLFWIFAVVAAAITAYKTGEWKFPDWWLK